MEKSKFFVVLPIVLSLFFVFSCSIDELDRINNNSVSIGNKVRSVQAFFVDRQSVLKQEIDVGSIELNEDGTIADLDMKEHPIFGHNTPNNYLTGYLWELNASFFKTFYEESGLLADFYSKRAQWLLAGDSQIHTYYLASILYHNDGMNWINIGEKILQETMDGYELTKTAKNDLTIFSFTGEKDAPHRYSWMKRDIVLNAKGKIASFLHYDKFENRLREYNTGNPLMDSILNSQVRRLLSNETHERMEMEYFEDGLLKELGSTFSVQSIRSDGKKIGGPDFLPKGSLQFFYDNQSNLKELHIINENNTFLRKYRFYYNETGYCTKKELINREGSVEFSVRFEYDFFD